MGATVGTIVFLLVFIIGGIAVQIFLSKKQNKWLGLILPIICLIFSIVSVLGVTLLISDQNVYQVIEERNDEGDVISRTEIEPVEKADAGSLVVSTIMVFFYCNIPTIILLAIYFACREKIKVHSAIEKMKIQDL